MDYSKISLLANISQLMVLFNVEPFEISNITYFVLYTPLIVGFIVSKILFEFVI